MISHQCNHDGTNIQGPSTCDGDLICWDHFGSCPWRGDMVLVKLISIHGFPCLFQHIDSIGYVFTGNVNHIYWDQWEFMAQFNKATFHIPNECYSYMVYEDATVKSSWWFDPPWPSYLQCEIVCVSVKVDLSSTRALCTLCFTVHKWYFQVTR